MSDARAPRGHGLKLIHRYHITSFTLFIASSTSTPARREISSLRELLFGVEANIIPRNGCDRLSVMEEFKNWNSNHRKEIVLSTTRLKLYFTVSKTSFINYGYFILVWCTHQY